MRLLPFFQATLNTDASLIFERFTSSYSRSLFSGFGGILGSVGAATLMTIKSNEELSLTMDSDSSEEAYTPSSSSLKVDRTEAVLDWAVSNWAVSD